MAKKKHSPKRSRHVEYVAGQGDFQYARTGKVLLTGDAVFATMSEFSIEGFTRVGARQIVAFPFTLLRKSPVRLFVSVANDMLERLPKGARVALACDSYLKWGLKRKNATILIGGISRHEKTTIQIYIFKDRTLQSIEEKTLPEEGSSQFNDAIASVIGQLQRNFPAVPIHVAAPLQPVSASDSHVQYVDESIFNDAVYVRLKADSNSNTKSWLLPAGIMTLSALFYLGSLFTGWSKYQSATMEFERTTADPVVASSGGASGGMLDKLQQQRFYLQEASKHGAIADKARALAAAVARVPQVRIEEISVAEKKTPADPLAPQIPDVILKISVPLTKQSAMEQGSAIGDIIAPNTGLASLRMARASNGFQDKEAEKRRQFNFEGLFQ